MTDKIKAFFQKKKANAKFMNAGKGYKLTDSHDTASSTSSERQPIKRAEPTEEARIAGQAALARLQAKKPDITRFNSSYAAIQARVKKELELEKAARHNLEKEIAEVSEKNSENKSNEFLAVTDVFFRCPSLSDKLLTHDEWKKKIKDFLYEQLTAEEAGLTACLIIQNCNTGKEKIQSCVETLSKYVDNILKNPDIEKYHKIRISNKIFQEKVVPVEGALEFLKAAGFEQTKLFLNSVEEDFLIWNAQNGSIENLGILAEALVSAEPIPIELDRNLQVLLPNQSNVRNELPPSFFTMSLEELRKEQQLRSEAIERSQMLRTKAMREKDEQRELRRYRFSLLRIRFPDNIILQGTFSVYEKLANVFEFVKDSLIDNHKPFYLRTAGSQKLTKEFFDKTLLELKLMPAVNFFFCWLETSEHDVAPKGYLKEELLLQNICIQNVINI